MVGYVCRLGPPCVRCRSVRGRDDARVRGYLLCQASSVFCFVLFCVFVFFFVPATHAKPRREIRPLQLVSCSCVVSLLAGVLAGARCSLVAIFSPC